MIMKKTWSINDKCEIEISENFKKIIISSSSKEEIKKIAGQLSFEVTMENLDEIHVFDHLGITEFSKNITFTKNLNLVPQCLYSQSIITEELKNKMEEVLNNQNRLSKETQKKLKKYQGTLVEVKNKESEEVDDELIKMKKQIDDKKGCIIS
jgi:hypothetical protein